MLLTRSRQTEGQSATPKLLLYLRRLTPAMPGDFSNTRAPQSPKAVGWDSEARCFVRLAGVLKVALKIRPGESAGAAENAYRASQLQS